MDPSTPRPVSVEKKVVIAMPTADLRWDPECCALNIVLSEDGHVCFLQEGGYCFRTVVGTPPFLGGAHYWEIHGDPKTENELKIGVANKKNFNLNTVLGDLYLHRHFAIMTMAGATTVWASCGTGTTPQGQNMGRPSRT